MEGYSGSTDWIKLERNVVVPRNPPLYRRYVDDTFNRRKKQIRDELFAALNSYHENINCTIDENPDHFLDTKFLHENGETITLVYDKPENFLSSGLQKSPNATKGMQLMVSCTEHTRSRPTSKKKRRESRKSFQTLVFPAGSLMLSLETLGRH